MPTSLVGVNTLVPNRLVKIAIEGGLVKELSGYTSVKSEVTVGSRSRLDLLLKSEHKRQCFVEIKNCSLVNGGTASFPDAVTSRGLKHLIELQTLASKGFRCVMFYLIQRMDVEVFKPADHIDPAYGKELRKAVKNGIEILVYDTIIDLKKIRIGKKIPFRL